MRKLVLLLIVALPGFGKPPPYDPAALPAAAAIRQHMLNQCAATRFNTLRASVDCGIAAHQAYAVTEKLRDMSLFRTYAAIARRAADDVDAGRISQSEAQKIVAAARADYQDKVQKSYDDFVRLAPVKTAPFDPALRTKAEAEHDRAVTACGAWTNAKMVEARVTCILAADKAFTAAIQLRDLDRFYGYASVLRVDAVDAEDGKRDPAQMAAQQQSLWRDFQHTLDQDYAGWKNGR